LRLFELAIVHLPADGQCHGKHRITERIFLGPGAGALGLRDQVQGGQVVRLGVVRHATGLALAVPGA
jgi:hypothetical protein